MAAPKPLAVLGIDPGSRWTAGVLRVGDTPVYGWTLGPVDELGRPRPNALDKIDDVTAFARYMRRILGQITYTLDLADARGYTRKRLAVEGIRVPVSWRTKVPLEDWLIPQTIARVVLVEHPLARVVWPDRHGKKPLHAYPAALRYRRPPNWGPCDNPRGERDHERSAYDIAGIALGML